MRMIKWEGKYIALDESLKLLGMKKRHPGPFFTNKEDGEIQVAYKGCVITKGSGLFRVYAFDTRTNRFPCLFSSTDKIETLNDAKLSIDNYLAIATVPPSVLVEKKDYVTVNLEVRVSVNIGQVEDGTVAYMDFGDVLFIDGIPDKNLLDAVKEKALNQARKLVIEDND